MDGVSSEGGKNNTQSGGVSREPTASTSFSSTLPDDQIPNNDSAPATASDEGRKLILN